MITPLHSSANFCYFTESSSDTLSAKKTWVNFPSELIMYDVLPNKIGVRITEGANYYYGWINLLAKKGLIESVPTASYTFYDYAFCKIPNYPFVFGQKDIITGVSNVAQSAPNSVVVTNSDNNLLVQTTKAIQSISLTNTAGLTVASKQVVNSTSTSIDMSGMAHGTYIIQLLFTDSSTYSKQVMW